MKGTNFNELHFQLSTFFVFVKRNHATLQIHTHTHTYTYEHQKEHTLSFPVYM